MKLTAKSTRRGFTLVELLVVISIVALLVAMLLPALRGARDAAIRVKCLSGIRQTAMGVLTYAADFGALPTYRYSAPFSYSRPKPDNPTQDEGLRMVRAEGYVDVRAMACPEGWASTNQPHQFFDLDTPNMDYLYWGTFPRQNDVRFSDEEKQYFAQELDAPGLRMLISGRLQADPARWPHGSNHERGFIRDIEQTDENGSGIGTLSFIDSMGGSLAFSDGHAQWHNVEDWTKYYSLRDLAWVDPLKW